MSLISLSEPWGSGAIVITQEDVGNGARHKLKFVPDDLTTAHVRHYCSSPDLDDMVRLRDMMTTYIDLLSLQQSKTLTRKITISAS